MDINDLFDGIAEAFRRCHQEIAEQARALTNQVHTGLEPETETVKTEKKVITEKRVEQDFPQSV